MVIVVGANERRTRGGEEEEAGGEGVNKKDIPLHHSIVIIMKEMTTTG